MSRLAIATTYKQLEKLVGEYRQALDGIADDDLNRWKPSAEQSGGGEMNTFAGLTMHTVQAAAWRVVHQVFGEDYPRDRDSEFSAQLTRSEIDQMFDELMRRFAELIDIHPVVDLASLPPTIRETSPEWTRMDYLIQVVGHTALHLGHAQIHRQLWMAERANNA